MSDVWIDLTDFLSWKGHFTGIQRVVYCYAIRFAADGARFFVYDAAGGRHVEVSKEFLESIKEVDRTAGAIEPKPNLKQQVKAAAKKSYRKIPEGAKVFIRPVVHASGEVVHTFLDRYVYKDKVAHSAFADYPTANFKGGDTAVLIGAGWNEAGALESLCAVKQVTGIRVIQHINDILPIYQPQLFADELPRVFMPYIDMALRNADVVTVISEATKRDVKIFCRERGIALPRIEVIRLGEDLTQVAPVKPEGFTTKDFILSVGTFEIRKNYLLLYQAVKLAQLEGKDFPDVVIVGRKGWLTEDLAHAIEHDPFTHNKIHWLQNVSDEELEWLYEQCMFTVFPSLCEGWGLPIVESLQHGKMCLTSGVSAMLEIKSEGVDYFPPYDARLCMGKVLQYTGANAYVHENKRVQDGYKMYSWDDSYRSFNEALGE